jgi:pimeloyl-ACP methyl ester carboxylesterase
VAFAKSNDLRIEYSVEGSGDETILLVMGLGARSADWGRDFPERLSERYRVVRFDNRGTGGSAVGDSPGSSDKPAEAWTLEDMAEDAVAVLDAVGVERAHVLGISMGGMISQLVALGHPERVNRLVLLSTNFGGPGIVRPNAELISLLYSPPRGTSPEEIVRLALQMITAPGFAEANQELIDELVEYARLQPTPKMVFATQLQAILSSDRSERVRDIRAPTLVIHGDMDPLIPYENGVRLAERIPGARLETLRGVGHVPSFEAPAELAKLVLDFFDA